MAHATGSLNVSANGQEYRLWLGMSVIADLQAKHGNEVFSKLEPPEGAPENWMPPLSILVDLIQGALERHHGDAADRWLVDDILAENADALPRLMQAAFPQGDAGNDQPAKRPKAG